MAPDPRELLRRHFGYPGFRPGQEELVRAVLEGRDALGVLPTGGGKSVCYQVPALALGGITLVLTPLVSLMEDQVRRALEVGLRGAFMSATQTAAERRATLTAARSGALDVLFVAPERLELASFRSELRDLDVRLLAVDEAHCISEWGHEFRPAYRRIGRFGAVLECPTLALTATATPDVREDVVDSLGLSKPLVVVRSFDRANLSWVVLRRRTLGERVRETYRILRRRPGPAIVYAPTRGRVEMVRDRLAAFGMPAQAYHAGLSGGARTHVQSAFMEGACRTVVATNAFGMGIDKADVRTVIHVSLPSTLEAYYQEAGRAGRDGDDAACVAFYAPPDLKLQRDMIDATHPSGKELRASLRRIRRLRARSPSDMPPVVRAASLSDAAEREGVLRALERVGAITMVADPDGRDGTEPPSGGFQDAWVWVEHRVDTAPLLRRRAVVVRKLNAVRRFARGRGCRRRALLRYFGERAPAHCGRCDRCESKLSI
ncbi:MAG: RecQ family ATP-dependent DNA helicase [Gemmatimonadota bacterium]|nr:RecQ family ATP-dependent DNA helicase [Gemmatimonadota bacterium]